jgi:hypothetical protein
MQLNPRHVLLLLLPGLSSAIAEGSEDSRLWQLRG